MLEFSKLPALYTARGFTQTTFANALGFTQGFLSSVVHGRKKISLGVLENMARQLGMSLPELAAALAKEITQSA